MKTLDARIRDSLRREAGVYHARAMPMGTVRRVRVRQVMSLAGSLAVVAALATSVMVLASALSGPAPERLASSPPFDGLPENWPTVRVEDPSVAFVEAPPGVDEARVLVSGTADDAYFSLFAYHGGERDGPCLGLAGPTTQPRGTSPGPPPEYSPAPQRGGFGGAISHTCAFPGPKPVPEESDLMILGHKEAGTRPVAVLGFVSSRVHRLSVCVYPGDPCTTGVDAPLFDGPRSWEGIRAFLFFPPPGREGTMVALDDQDRALARGELCTWSSDVSGGCRIDSEQMTTAGTVPQEIRLDVPDGWPNVTLGGFDTPYVDHQVSAGGDVDPGVIGVKRAVLSGFVAFGPFDDVPWSVSMSQVDATDSGYPGWCLDLYVGYTWSMRAGTYRGSTVTGTCALNGQPLLPPRVADMLAHGGVGTFEIGSSSERWWDLEAYVGIVSTGVASVELIDPSGVAVPIELRAADPGSPRFFVFFPRPGTRGVLVARDAVGSELARWDLCLPAILAEHPGRRAGQAFGCDGT